VRILAAGVRAISGRHVDGVLLNVFGDFEGGEVGGKQVLGG
jgi:hypothetical protein